MIIKDVIRVPKRTFEEEIKEHERVFNSANIRNNPSKKKLADAYYAERNKLFDNWN